MRLALGQPWREDKILTAGSAFQTSYCIAEGEIGENPGAKLSPGRSEGWGGRCFKICQRCFKKGALNFFISHYPTLIGNKLH